MLTTDKDCKMPKIEKQTSNIGDTIGFYQGYPYFNTPCSHLLPCGICDRTNVFCPLHGVRPYEPTWTTSSIGGKKND